jgi:probable rRNA maturation factor
VIAVDVMAGPGDWSRIADIEALARRAIDATLAVAAHAPPMSTELSVLLTDDAGVRELNRRWRGLAKPTNVLSFPGSGPASPDGVRHLGDIADHAAHLIVHGTLHLLGHDHEIDEEAEGMEALEIAALARLGIANPYRDMAA